jgi:cell division protein FtsB
MVAASSARGLLARLFRPVVAPVLWAAVVGYFAFHAVQGDRGLIALADLEGELATARAALADLRAEREGLEILASRLRPDSLDPDLLDERARAMLDLSHPHDLVVLTPPAAR